MTSQITGILPSAAVNKVVPIAAAPSSKSRDKNIRRSLCPDSSHVTASPSPNKTTASAPKSTDKPVVKKPRVYNRITPTIKAIFDKQTTPDKDANSRSSLDTSNNNSNHGPDSRTDVFDSFDLTCVKSVQRQGNGVVVVSAATDDELSLDDIIMKEINQSKEDRRTKTSAFAATTAVKRSSSRLVDGGGDDENARHGGNDDDKSPLSSSSKKSRESIDQNEQKTATMTLRNRAPSGFGANRNWF